jgi:hypothetical protein
LDLVGTELGALLVSGGAWEFGGAWELGGAGKPKGVGLPSDAGEAEGSTLLFVSLLELVGLFGGLIGGPLLLKQQVLAIPKVGRHGG